MNGTKIVLDTNIILYLLDGNKELAVILNEMEIFVSIITEIELLGYQEISDLEKSKVKLFLSECQIIPLNVEIKNICVEFKQNHKIKTPDAIVAATPRYLGIPLFTADKGFNKLPNLDAIIYNY